MKRRRKDCTLVMVTWVDSRQPVSKWQHLASLPPPAEVSCASVGWMLRRDRKTVELVQSLGDLEDDVQCMGLMTIPRRCVLKMEPLQEKPRRRRRAAKRST